MRVHKIEAVGLHLILTDIALNVNEARIFLTTKCYLVGKHGSVMLSLGTLIFLKKFRSPQSD